MELLYVNQFLYFYLCKSEHFTTLNKISLKCQTAYEIITKFMEEGGLAQLKCFFKNNAFIYQFVYSTLFPKYFCRIDEKATENKCCFELAFNNYNAQKNGYSLIQQIPNIVKIEDNDCNSLTVELVSDASEENIKRKEDKPKRKRKQQNEKIKKREEKKKKLESDLEVNREKLNNIKKKNK